MSWDGRQGLAPHGWGGGLGLIGGLLVRGVKERVGGWGRPKQHKRSDCNPQNYKKTEICSQIAYMHEIKRCLLLGRKFMTNLDSILKSRDITLPTKVRLVKAIH